MTTTTPESGHYKLRLIGTATAVIVGAVAIGFVPRCDDVQTRAMAAEQHDGLRRECVENSDRIMEAIEQLADAVRAALEKRSEHAPRRRRD